MTFLLIAFLFLSSPFALAQSLTCRCGVHVEMPDEETNSIKDVQCQKYNATKCLRVEGLLVGNFTGSGEASANATAAACATEHMCNQECEALLRNFTAELNTNTTDLSKISYIISSCAKACCDGNNCNSDSVADILAGQATMETTTPDGAPSTLQNNFLVFLLTILSIVLHNVCA